MRSKRPYPSVTKDFGDSFGVSPSKEPKHETDTEFSHNYFEGEAPTMSHTLEKLNRTDILKNALETAQPKPSRATHLKLLSEHEWKLVHEARKINPKTGLQQLFICMQRAYQDNDEAFFASYGQFYNAYRQAVGLFGLAPIRVRKPKSK
jgi:hypothetical protein